MKIFNHTTTKLSKADALRALFGKAIHIRTEIEASGSTQVLGSTSTTYVDKLFPRKQPAAQLGTLPEYARVQTGQPRPRVFPPAQPQAATATPSNG